MPEKITARYRITTPMFIGDAAQQASGISPAAVKGALRFWWRALNWGRIRQTKDTDAEALRQLHKEESELFGSAADQGAGQSSFRITVSAEKLTVLSKGAVHKQFRNYAAARYLGYGLMEAFASSKKGTHEGQLVRECINENQLFVVTLTSRKPIDNSILNALKVFGLLGALGSRARHGMGSVSLEDIRRNDDILWTAPQNKTEYSRVLNALIDSKDADLPPHSAFSKHSRVDILLSGDNPYSVLDGFGQKMLFYRSWGRSDQNGESWVLGKISERRFKPDHDWSKGVRPQDFHPRRVIFGLPHNYGKGDWLSVEPAQHDRRASPLLFHVQQVGAEYFGVSILFQAEFLPVGESIDAGGKNVSSHIEWSILHEFLDGTTGQGDVRFSQRERVL